MSEQNKNLILTKKNVLTQLDEETGEGGFSGPKNNTYAQILRDLGAGLDPQILDDFSQQFQDPIEAKKSDKTSSKDFEKHQAKEQRSEKEYQPTPEQAFGKGRSGPRH